MHFNSQLFILVFLPFVAFINYLLSYKSEKKLMFLIAVSIVFYGYWDLKFIPFLLVSVLVNWLFSFVVTRKLYLVIALGFNLSLLAYYKYFNFFLNLFNLHFTQTHTYSIVAPLAISFITFEHICFLVDR